jgi:HSP20 family protein
MRRRILRWGPPPDLPSVREAMDRLVEESFVRAPRRFMEPILGHELPMDIYQTAQAVVVKAPIPGVKPEDLDITIVGDTLTVKGQTRPDVEVGKEQYIRREISYGEISRSVTLPGGLDSDQAEAQFEDGVLTLTIPKAEEVRPKVVQVKMA